MTSSSSSSPSSVLTCETLLQELLQCAVCLGQLADARILPCCHSFCHSCLNTHIQTSLSNHLTFHHTPTFPCPTCRVSVLAPPEGVNGFLKDFRLVKFKDVLKSVISQKKDEVCGICLKESETKPALSYCTECQTYFCYECTGKHNFTFSNHFIFSLTRTNTPNHQKCLQHSEEAGRFFCKTCNIQTCIVCALNDHKDHLITNCREMISSQRRNLQKKKCDLDIEIRKAQSIVFNLTCLEGQLKEIYEESCLLIQKQSRKLVNRIKNDEKKIQQELDLIYVKKCDDIFAVKEDCKDHLVSYQTLLSHISCILQHDNDTQEVLDRFPQLLQEVELVGTSQGERWQTEEFEKFVRFVPGHSFKFGKIQNVELKRKPALCASARPTCEVRDEELADAHNSPPTITEEDASEESRYLLTKHTNHNISDQLTQQEHPASSNTNPDYDSSANRNTLYKIAANRNARYRLSNGNAQHNNTDGRNSSDDRSTSNLIGSVPADSRGRLFSLLSTQLIRIFGGFGRSAGDLSLPYNVCFMTDGKLIVAEDGNRRLQIFDKDSDSVATIASGEIIPRCVTMVTEEKIAVTDELTKSIKVYSSDGNLVKTIFPSASTLPYGLATSLTGNFVFTDMIFENVTVMTQCGRLEQQFGGHGASDVTFNNPGYVDCDLHDNIYVSDSSNHSIKVFDSSGVFVHRFGSYGSLNGQLRYPKAVVVDDADRVFVADSGNDRVVVFTSEGQFLQVLLTHSHGLQRPTGLACFKSELLAVSMPDLNEVRIYKINVL